MRDGLNGRAYDSFLQICCIGFLATVCKNGGGRWAQQMLWNRILTRWYIHMSILNRDILVVYNYKSGGWTDKLCVWGLLPFIAQQLADRQLQCSIPGAAATVADKHPQLLLFANLVPLHYTYFQFTALPWFWHCYVRNVGFCLRQWYIRSVCAAWVGVIFDFI